MIASLKPYEKMKPSGLPWLGRIPAHWETRRLRDVAELRVSSVDKHVRPGQKSVRLCNYVDVTTNERILEGSSYMLSTASDAEIDRFRLAAGDVVITKDSETWDDIAVPSLVEYAAPDFLCGYHLAILRPRDALAGGFLHRAIEECRIAAQFHVRANGVTRFGLSQGAIKNVSIPLPPPYEQKSIARFLDYAGTRLNRAIEAKRTMIGLLNEQKQATIHQAVTRGLDPTVPFKPSGMPWLGDIPEHWNVSRLSAVGRFGKGKGGSKQDDTDRGVACIRYGEIYTTYADRIVEVRTRIADARSSSYSPIQTGDVLLTASGEDLEEIGQAAAYLSAERAVCGGDLVILRPSQGFDSLFLSYALNSRSSVWQKAQMGRGTTVKHIYPAQLRSLTCAFPPPAEQQAIVAFLDEQAQRVDTGIAKLERECELLAEYRTRLTSDVVTGKLDVREAAKALPELDDDLAELVEAPTSDAEVDLEFGETP